MLTRIQLLCMTPKTRLEWDGQKIERPDYSIHHTTDRRNRSKTCSATPKTRPGKTYPGGRSLRRAHSTLSARVKEHTNNPTGIKPGSMQQG